MYDFNKVISRIGTGSVKWDFIKENIGDYEDIIPLWVADMDFSTCNEIINEMQKNVAHGVFGYVDVNSDFYSALFSFYKRHHDVEIKKEWINYAATLIQALNIIVRGFGKGKSVLIQTPVYPQFKNAILNGDASIVINELKLIDNKYEIDFIDFEEKIKKNNVKIFILCNPHNPVGRVWTKEEMHKMIKICKENNVLIVSDEIHCDLVYKGFKHESILKFTHEIGDNLILLNSVTKTFNLGGLQFSNVIIPNKEIRDRYVDEMVKFGVGRPNTFGMIATEAGYKYGDEWLNEVKEYIEENKNFVQDFIEKNIKEIKVIKNEATYLLWLDCRGLNLDDYNLSKFLCEKAKIGVNLGNTFGEGGEGFIRMNIGCSRSLLEKALNNLKEAIDNR